MNRAFNSASPNFVLNCFLFFRKAMVHSGLLSDEKEDPDLNQASEDEVNSLGGQSVLVPQT